MSAFGGIIAGGIGGVGQAMQAEAEQKTKAQLERETYAANAGVQLDKQNAAEVFKAALATQQRDAQVARIGAESGKIADAQIGQKRGIIEGNIADKSEWTPEQQAAVDQSLALDKKGIVNDAKTHTQAAINTGDIDPKSAAVLMQKDDALLYKSLWEQSKEDGRNSRSDARIEAQAENADKRLAALLAHYANKGEGNPTKEALSFLSESRKEIAAEAATAKALYSQKYGMTTNAKQRADLDAEFAPKFAEIDTKRGQIEQDYQAMRTKVGLPALAPKADAPAPAPATPKSARPPLSQFQTK